MGMCFGSSYALDPINAMDKRIQAKQGRKTAEQLAMQNGKFADTPENYRDKEEKRLDPKDEGKWVSPFARTLPVGVPMYRLAA